MGKVICVVAAALAVLFSLPGDASADGMTVKHHARKVVAHTSVDAPRLSGSVLVLPAVRRLWALWRRRLLDPVHVRRLVSITTIGQDPVRGQGGNYLSRAGF